MWARRPLENIKRAASMRDHRLRRRANSRNGRLLIFAAALEIAVIPTTLHRPLRDLVTLVLIEANLLPAAEVQRLRVRTTLELGRAILFVEYH